MALKLIYTSYALKEIVLCFILWTAIRQGIEGHLQRAVEFWSPPAAVCMRLSTVRWCQWFAFLTPQNDMPYSSDHISLEMTELKKWLSGVNHAARSSILFVEIEERLFTIILCYYKRTP